MKGNGPSGYGYGSKAEVVTQGYRVGATAAFGAGCEDRKCARLGAQRQQLEREPLTLLYSAK